MYSKGIYEILPIAYILSGLLALFLLDHPFGQATGFIMIAAGLIVKNWRRSYRRENQAA